VCAVTDWLTAIGAILGAIGTVGAVGVALILSQRGDRQMRERDLIAKQQLARSIATLARNWFKAFRDLTKKYTPPPTSDPFGHFLRSLDEVNIETPADALAAIPLYQLADVSLITAVLELRGVMGRLGGHIDAVRADKGGALRFDPGYLLRLSTPAVNAGRWIGGRAERVLGRGGEAPQVGA
jgi:hypothetical protein